MKEKNKGMLCSVLKRANTCFTKGGKVISDELDLFFLGEKGIFFMRILPSPLFPGLANTCNLIQVVSPHSWAFESFQTHCS